MRNVAQMNRPIFEIRGFLRTPPPDGWVLLKRFPLDFRVDLLDLPLKI
ncbi:MAG: hypothetical protein ACTFAK_11580 [Candidatus Electronema sp. VV]